MVRPRVRSGDRLATEFAHAAQIITGSSMKSTKLSVRRMLRPFRNLRVDHGEIFQ